MTSRDFCYWLQGYFEIMEAESPGGAFTVSAKATACIRNHLAMVFKHEIDPAMGGKEHQAILNALHAPSMKPDTSGVVGPPSHHGDLLLRC